MKSIFISLLILTGSIAMSQNLGEQAILKECKDEKLPDQCTEDKLKAGITALVSGDIAEIEKNNNNASFFTISVSFISDENGKIIPSETEIRCENNEKLKTAIGSYINSLPEFIPKSSKLKEKRSVHTLNISFLQNLDNQNYHIAGYQELKDTPLITRNYIFDDNPPVYPGCNADDSILVQSACMQKSLATGLLKNFTPPDVDAGRYMMHVALIVAIDGNVRIEEIAGANKPIQEEVYRAVRRLPKLKPALKKGIPVTAHLNLPLTINISTSRQY